MYNSDNKIMPPLRVWLLLLLVVSVLAVLVYLFEEQEQGRDNFAKTSYIQNKIKTSTGRPLILVIGTSLTQCALDSSSILEASVKNIITGNPVILKIWKKGGNLVTMSEVVNQLKQFHPDLLLVEANMLFYSPQVASFSNKLLDAFHQLVRLRLNKVYFPEEKPIAGFQDMDKPAKNFRNGVVDTSQLISFRNLAVKLQQNGTKILMVNIPLEESEEAKKWNSPDTSIFNANLNFIRRKVAFKYLNINKYLDKSYYLDKGHMNQKGYKTLAGGYVMKYPGSY